MVILYVVSPIDGAPDFIPRIGRLDDLAVIWLAWTLLSRAPVMSDFFESVSKKGQVPTQSAHQTLGLNPGATPTEIKRAYRKLIRTYHPDKFVHMGPDYEKAASEKTQLIVEAYRQLQAATG